MKILLVGAGGMLARDLLREAPPNQEIVPYTSSELDVTDPTALETAVEAIQPDVVINAAAYTKVDQAETDQASAFEVNGTAPGLIGRAARAVAAKVVHYSTDYVFDGCGQEPYRETDATCPIGAYGASKLAGEHGLARSGSAHLILRTQWLFGLNGSSFARAMWTRAKARQPTRVVNDQSGRPTYTVDLARATWRLLETERQHGAPTEGWPLAPHGIVHVANSGVATWFEVADRIFEAAGARELLQPCSTADYPTPARRPAWSVLSTELFEGIAGARLPTWEDGIDRFLVELRNEPN